MTVSLFYLLAQMAGAGGLVALLLDIHGRLAQSVVIAVVGVLMIVYVLVGGMAGTTWVQIIKAVLLVTGAAVMTVMVLAKFDSTFRTSSAGADDDAPGRRAGWPIATCWHRARSTADRSPSKINLLSLGWRWCSARRGCRTF